MGCRLHVRKINKIEYGDGVFNNTGDIMHDFLLGLSEDSWCSEDEERIELPKEDFKEGIEHLHSMSNEDYEKKWPDVKKLYKKEELCSILNKLYEEADPDNDTIAFDWF